MILKYNTRDENGDDIIKDVVIKEFEVHKRRFTCPICHSDAKQGCKTKDIVSSSFTDWASIGEWVCSDCSRLFSLYPYSYIVDPDGIRLLNVRELRDQLVTPQKPPFMFVITTSQKKHLFYNAPRNENAYVFGIKLERETIWTTRDRMQKLFDFVECLQTMGASKTDLKNGMVPYNVWARISNPKLVEYLRNQLKLFRDIQIPLFCGQKRDITEEEAICCINSILTA